MGVLSGLRAQILSLLGKTCVECGSASDLVQIVVKHGRFSRDVYVCRTCGDRHGYMHFVRLEYESSSANREGTD